MGRQTLFQLGCRQLASSWVISRKSDSSSREYEEDEGQVGGEAHNDASDGLQGGVGASARHKGENSLRCPGDKENPTGGRKDVNKTQMIGLGP
jgi:hypothetical protein